MSFLAAVLFVAQAQAGGLGLALGLEHSIDDPFLNHRAIRAGVSYAPREQLAFEGSVAAFPNLGEADWKPLTSQLVNNNHVSPDLSPMKLRLDARVHVFAIRSSFGDWWGALDVSGGLGGVKTIDDLEALQQEGDQYAEATASQWHPSSSWGLAYQLVTEFGDSSAVGARLRCDSIIYLETVSSTTLETKRIRSLALEAVLWL